MHDDDEALIDELVAHTSTSLCQRTEPDDLRAMYRYFLSVDVPFDKLVAAVEAGDARSALVEHRLLGEGKRYTIADVARDSGLPETQVADVLRACGLPVPQPGEAALAETDMSAVRLFAGVESFFGSDTVLRFSRVMSQSVSRVAEAAVTMFGVNVEDPLIERGGSQAELSATVDDALASLGVITELFAALFARHALDASRRISVSRTDASTHATLTVTVGFADLVRSTEWTRDLSPRELGEALGEFERLAREALSGKARVVKSIGDEVMFMAVDPVDACRTALHLAELVGNEARLPQLRVGLAHGAVVGLDGDLYGSVVNLAARLVQVAEPGQVLTSPAVAHAVGAGKSGDAAHGRGLVFAELPPRSLAGFDEPIAPLALRPR